MRSNAPEDQIARLNALREQIVRIRRALVQKMLTSNEYQAEPFIKLQEFIEAIDRALKDEKEYSTPPIPAS